MEDLVPAPTVSQWQGLDREETFYHNRSSEIKRALLQRWGWDEHSITYSHNSWGFRSQDCVEFSDVADPSLITMGCSFTYGTGLPAHCIWPQLVADSLGLKLLNLATPGHGLTLGTKWLLDQGHTLVNPRALIILIPPPGRLSWMERYSNTVIGNTYHMREFDTYPRIIKNTALNSFAQYTSDYQTIQLWATHRGIPVYCFDGFGAVKEEGLARDLRHLGKPWHRSGADLVLRTIHDTNSSI